MSDSVSIRMYIFLAGHTLDLIRSKEVRLSSSSRGEKRAVDGRDEYEQSARFAHSKVLWASSRVSGPILFLFFVP